MAKPSQHLFGVIMAGGSGQRFWPLSRAKRPKQCMALLGSGTMLQQAAKRLSALVNPKNMLVITHAGIRDLVASQLPGLPRKNIVAEPSGRDTAACIALSACLALRQDPEALLVIIPADHLIGEVKPWTQALKAAALVAEEHAVWVTLGITPDEPSTAYGYIQPGELFHMSGDKRFHRVRKFHEKPDRNTARRFLQNGLWWNSGMFVAKASFILQEMRRFLPVHADMCDDLLASKGEKDWARILAGAYPALPKISLDYGVLEKTDNAAAASLSCTWDDLGSWPALARHLPADAQDNILLGNIALEDSRGNIVRAEPGHCIALIGLNDMVIVQTPDATLICPRNRSQDIKKLLDGMGKNPGQKGLL